MGGIYKHSIGCCFMKFKLIHIHWLIRNIKQLVRAFILKGFGFRHGFQGTVYNLTCGFIEQPLLSKMK